MLCRPEGRCRSRRSSARSRLRSRPPRSSSPARSLASLWIRFLGEDQSTPNREKTNGCAPHWPSLSPRRAWVGPSPTATTSSVVRSMRKSRGAGPGLKSPGSRQVSRLARLMDRPRAERDTIINFASQFGNEADFELCRSSNASAVRSRCANSCTRCANPWSYRPKRGRCPWCGLCVRRLRTGATANTTLPSVSHPIPAAMRRFIKAVPPQGFMQRCFVTATLALGGAGGSRSRGRPGRRRDRGRRGRATRLPVPPCPIETPWR